MSFPPHYSPSVQAGKFVYTSGQLPLITRVPLKVPVGIQNQARLVFQKVADILAQYQLDKSHIIKTTAYITEMDHWGPLNEVYAEFFGELKPARSIIPVNELHFGCEIELEAVAYSSKL